MRKGNLDKMTAIRVSLEQYKQLQRIAEEQERDVSWILRKAAEEYIERHPARKR